MCYRYSYAYSAITKKKKNQGYPFPIKRQNRLDWVTFKNRKITSILTACTVILQ